MSDDQRRGDAWMDQLEDQTDAEIYRDWRNIALVILGVGMILAGIAWIVVEWYFE